MIFGPLGKFVNTLGFSLWALAVVRGDLMGGEGVDLADATVCLVLMVLFFGSAAFSLMAAIAVINRYSLQAYNRLVVFFWVVINAINLSTLVKGHGFFTTNTMETGTLPRTFGRW